jgi:hypothetical protein
VTGIAGQHVNKSDSGSFRQRAQSSVQYVALSRSAMGVGRHPTDPNRRAFVLGKANYTDERPARSFRIESHPFVYAGQPYNVGVIADVRSEALTIEQVLGGGSAEPRERPRDTLADALLAARDSRLPLATPIEMANGNNGGWTLSDLARAVGRSPSDGTLRRALDELAERGLMYRDDAKRWHYGTRDTPEPRNAINDDDGLAAEP